VESAEPDLKSSQVVVKGAFDPAQLAEYVYKRTGKHAVIVKQEPEKKEKEEAKDGNKEEKKGESGGDKGSKGGDEEKKEKKEGSEAKTEAAAAAPTEEEVNHICMPWNIATLILRSSTMSTQQMPTHLRSSAMRTQMPVLSCKKQVRNNGERV
jgi:hypothetical protein